MSTTFDGLNAWLSDEMYARWKDDRESVPVEWQEVFDRTTQVPLIVEEPHLLAASVVEPPAVAPAPAPSEAPQKPAEQPPAVQSPAVQAPPQAAPAAAQPAPPAHIPPAPARAATTRTLKGASALVVANMEASLHVPTATSVRAVPAKLLEDNRTVINGHLRRARGGKISFTHLIGYALVRAVADLPTMNLSYTTVDGKPTAVTPEHVNLGLAIDLVKSNGDRQLVVAAVKAAETMDFATFWQTYEDLVRRARVGKLTADDFKGVTVSLTNPGGFGTVHSVPRLTEGQGAIIGVGSMEYPAEFQGASPDTIATLGVSKVITLTSTYDHRVIQGAQSGEFLRRMHELLLGADNFYDDIFAALHIPYAPVRWMPDVAVLHEGELSKETRVHKLIHAYRARGHLIAHTNPLSHEVKSHADLDVLSHGLTLWDLDRHFATGDFASSTGRMTMPLRDILGVLRDAYCRTTGVEYTHIQVAEQRRWVQDHVERKAEQPESTKQLHVLARLSAAEAFEAFLQTKYVGQKRFSLEGAETLIPLLDEILQGAAEVKLDEVVIGMPHRGRLNVLCNIVGKSYAQVFREFEGQDPHSAHGSGDVKYHLGAEGTFTARTGAEVAVSLVSNPSHLEAVDGVLEGVVRAKQDMIDRGAQGFSVLPLMMHGDAAFAGQGVVAETLEMSQLRGYRTGGTIHIIVNNQVGFTTDPASSRSTQYSSDVARMLQAPIFHVNADDPDAVVRVARLALEFRQTYHKDVVIDMVCYRRRGHNEGDDPSMTQPQMYRVIDARPSTRYLYTEALVGRGDVTPEEAEHALSSYRSTLESAFQQVRDDQPSPQDSAWSNTARHAPPDPAVVTAVDRSVVDAIAATQTELPEGFTPHPRILSNVLEKRVQMVKTDSIDWGFGEILAIGSLLLDGHPVRMAGQDTRRGTFVQRHAALTDYQSGAEYVPLKSLSGAAPFHIYDSLLSEFAAMGFEYGYSVARPAAWVAWEAQFGDFANGAQTIIDEFISSGEAKWGQRSGLTLLLPHGYEGQGPDHSSARIERFLQLCAEDNMVVAMPSTPASYFHLIRRHVKGNLAKPHIVFTPKSMLRLKAAVSATSDFTTGSFQPVTSDPRTPDPANVSRVLLCTGKVYWELDKQRTAENRTDTAVLRIEQLYPTPLEAVHAALSAYPAATDVVWVQEEPANQGAWPFMAMHLPEAMPSGRQLRRISRRASASPAVGSHHAHDSEQAALVAAAFTR